MRAIIIAAGRGIRLGNLTEELPKSLLPILGKPLLEYNLEALRRNGISSISVVTGYKAEKFTYPDLTYYSNPEFAQNNILHSLMKASEEFDDDLIVSYSDIWYHDDVLRQLMNAKGNIVLSVDTHWQPRYENRNSHPPSQAEKVTLDKKNTVQRIGKHIENNSADGEFIGLFKLSRDGALLFRSEFASLMQSMNPADPFEHAKEWQKAYVTDFIQWLLRKKIPVYVSKHSGKWLEMDTAEDYEQAAAIILKHS